MSLFARRHWIFDLDGTLTVAVHDFDALRAELDIPLGIGLLEHLAMLPPVAAGVKEARIAQWEAEHAEIATAQADAAALLLRLSGLGCRLGVLTRNSASIARRTLEVAGLAAYFEPDDCIGRDLAAPKPAPDGIHLLLRRWGARADDAVMVGDWGFDVEAGRAAGVATVLVDRDGRAGRFASFADHLVTDLGSLTG